MSSLARLIWRRLATILKIPDKTLSNLLGSVLPHVAYMYTRLQAFHFESWEIDGDERHLAITLPYLFSAFSQLNKHVTSYHTDKLFEALFRLFSCGVGLFS